jgi:hypothetical protein
MADMIDASEAKARLGCDDATLQGYINNGTIRAQRQGGRILCNADDVAKLAGGGGDDDGTIVLTGDSDDLSIDLGKVVDDSSETIVQSRGGADDSSITFGDELEVVSFDDNANTSELSFDETHQTGQAGNLSFTDSNTAVMTAVDETAVGATTAPLDFQTQGDVPASAASARRSVRSNRAMVMREEAEPTHWIWPTCLILTVLVVAFFIVPYYVMAVVPKDGKLANNNRAIGAQDNGWTRMAGGIAGFSVEPNRKIFTDNFPGVEWVDIKDAGETQATWRYRQFRGKYETPAARADSLTITELEFDPETGRGTAHAKLKRTDGGAETLLESYPVSSTRAVDGDPNSSLQLVVEVWRGN